MIHLPRILREAPPRKRGTVKLGTLVLTYEGWLHDRHNFEYDAIYGLKREAGGELIEDETARLMLEAVEAALKAVGAGLDDLVCNERNELDEDDC